MDEGSDLDGSFESGQSRESLLDNFSGELMVECDSENSEPTDDQLEDDDFYLRF
jgi:hypothetical protein